MNTSPSKQFRRMKKAFFFTQPIILIVAVISLGATLILGIHHTTPDTFFCLVAGRDLTENGLPWTNSFTILGSGRPWINQQWLAHWLVYRMHGAMGYGGLTVLRAAISLLLCFACLAYPARRGAGTLPIALGGLAGLALTVFKAKIRAQMFAEILFVLILWILSEHSRAPSKRTTVALTLTLLLWANIHGSVLLGVTLVALCGMTSFFERAHRVGFRSTWKHQDTGIHVVSLFLGGAAPFATPYGWHMLGYYLSTAANPVFAEYLVEWMPPDWEQGSFLIVIGTLSAILLFLGRRALSRFEQASTLLLLAMSFGSVRHALFLGYLLMFFLPPLIQRVLPEPLNRAVNSRWLWGVGILFAAIVLALFVHALPIYERNIVARWPEETSRTVAALAGRDGRVYADLMHADRLLWHQPTLSGRMAFDIRFEVLNPAEVEGIHRAFRDSSGAVLNDYLVVVVDDPRKAKVLEGLGFELVTKDPLALVYTKPR